MALSVYVAFGQFLLLEVISHYLGTRGGLGIGNLIDIHIHDIVATHLGGDSEVGDDDVLLCLYIVIIV